jgi:hypothetical protein
VICKKRSGGNAARTDAFQQDVTGPVDANVPQFNRDPPHDEPKFGGGGDFPRSSIRASRKGLVVSRA